MFRSWALEAIGSAPSQESITGIASVIDGDSIEIHGQRIRLIGIDASQSSQLCVRPTGERWRCAEQGTIARVDWAASPMANGFDSSSVAES